MTDPVARLKEWFDNRARPFLEQHETDKVVELDQDLDNHYDPVTVVRAPTGGGKTIVFFVNAAMSSLCGPERSTSILMFPTRLLNDDMFRRLIAFVAKLRANLPNEDRHRRDSDGDERPALQTPTGASARGANVSLWAIT